MTKIPTEASPESTLMLIREPYDFIRTRCAKHGTDLFEARLMMEPTICMTGPKAAELFYDEDRFIRTAAVPAPVRKVLFGEGGVQGLDSESHRHRKRLLMALTTRERAEPLADRFESLWDASLPRWAGVDHIVLYDQVKELLTRSVLPWAGVPVDEAEINSKTRQLSALYEGAGSIGIDYWRARLDRWLIDRWAADLVMEVRNGHREPPKESPLAMIAWHTHLDGELLEPRVAAVELVNILRPVVAVSVYLTFVAHALHKHTGWKEPVDEEDATWFAQEVRRVYPFFPAVAARVREEFEWRGYRFPKGRRVLLDVYGTNRDPRTWANPSRFDPGRFRDGREPLYGFIPQGGGDPERGHRCPGEPLTLALMERMLSCLRRTTYSVPEQDLELDRSKLPALPRSGIRLDVHPIDRQGVSTEARQSQNA